MMSEAKPMPALKAILFVTKIPQFCRFTPAAFA